MKTEWDRCFCIRDNKVIRKTSVSNKIVWKFQTGVGYKLLHPRERVRKRRKHFFSHKVESMIDINFMTLGKSIYE